MTNDFRVERFGARALAISVSFALVVATGCSSALVNPRDMRQVQRAIRQRFPDVRQLSTTELATWLDDSSRPQPLLLDARAAKEYAVSHLRGARRVGSKPELADVPRDTPIVVYCSIGYRSSARAKKLAAAGFTDVANLEGSIFQWANERRPVYRGDEQLATPVVHPYNAAWGRLLDPSLVMSD